MKRIELKENERISKRVIGGTDASTILSCNKYKSIEELEQELTSGERKAVPDNEAMARGRFLEPHLRAEFAFLHPNLKVEEPPAENWLFCDDEHEELTASFDGLIYDKETSELKGILEIKTRDIYRLSDWERWEQGVIPKNYYCQILHYLMISKAEYCLLVSHGIKRNKDKEIEWSKTLYQKITYEEAKQDIDYLRQKEIVFLNRIKDIKKLKKE